MNFLNDDTVGGNRCEIQQSDMIYYVRQKPILDYPIHVINF
jgi:hypothetical protein